MYSQEYEYVKFLIIGDVHAEFAPFQKAVQFAVDNDLHLVSVGDLIDNGPDGFKVLTLFKQLADQDKATLIIGNHEWKIHRWLLGRDVKITAPNQVTVDQMNSNQFFKDVFKDLMSKAVHFTQLNDNMFVTHAAMSKNFWDTKELTAHNRDRMMYSFADNSQIAHYRGETYPIRLYDWVDDVPAGIKLFVGHDPRPMIGVPDFDNFQVAPSVVKNNNGGITVFLDTGSGKGGTLWGTVVNSVTSEIEQFRNFSI